MPNADARARPQSHARSFHARWCRAPAGDQKSMQTKRAPTWAASGPAPAAPAQRKAVAAVRAADSRAAALPFVPNRWQVVAVLLQAAVRVSARAQPRPPTQTVSTVAARASAAPPLQVQPAPAWASAAQQPAVAVQPPLVRPPVVAVVAARYRGPMTAV